jgi:hypothetical protein
MFRHIKKTTFCATLRLQSPHNTQVLTHAFVDVLSDLVVAAMAARVDIRAAAGAIGVVCAAYERMTVVEVSQDLR